MIMILNRSVVGVIGLVLARAALTQAYCIKDSYVGSAFYGSWQWETFDDPTHGRVNYVDQTTSINANLTYGAYCIPKDLHALLNVTLSATADKFIMRVDSTNYVPPSARGRSSVRIISNAAYGDSITLLDLSHMPEGCGTWPAFWSLSAAGPWPRGGEIDIIEGE